MDAHAKARRFAHRPVHPAEAAPKVDAAKLHERSAALRARPHGASLAHTPTMRPSRHHQAG